MTKFILVLGLLALIHKSHAGCGACSTVSYASCIDATTYELCLDGAAKSGIIGECPAGKVCTDEAGICKLSTEATATCDSNCNKCLEDVPFACVSATEIVLCDPTTNKPNSGPFPCPDKKYCNIESYTASPAGDLCTSSCESQPTCSEGAVVETPAEEYTSSCTGTETAGLYPNKSDPTCKTYVYCEELNGKMYSIQYDCSTGYYNKELKACVATKPSYCT